MSDDERIRNAMMLDYSQLIIHVVSLEKQLEKEKKKNEKAIEYIMTELITEYDIRNNGCVSGSDLPVDAITPILEILKGEENDI